jgi:hypothetical protein
MIDDGIFTRLVPQAEVGSISSVDAPSLSDSIVSSTEGKQVGLATTPLTDVKTN